MLAEDIAQGEEAPAQNPYQTLIVTREGKVGLITLNRPKALNALNTQLIGELNKALKAFDTDPEIGCIVITGNEKAFAAGVDIKEMHTKSFVEAYGSDFLAPFDKINNIRKPIIAAVGGYALGGGCELAMCCDIILAADNAVFGQPEINLGIMPGAGGTQRLTRAVGKAKAMELCLTGRQMNAEEAERASLVSRVVPAGELLGESPTISGGDRRLTEIIRVNSQRVSHIVESILSLSRRDKTAPRQIELCEWARAFVAEFVSTMELYEGSLSLTGDSEVAEIEIDPTHLHQVLWNLCDNAVKYASLEAGAIAVELRCGHVESTGRPFLEVSDRGAGIPADIVEQVFEPFFTAQTGGNKRLR